MALLSKDEAHSIHAFLDDMDYSTEWAMYESQEPEYHNHDRRQLTKATKDLMALEAPPQYSDYNTHYQYNSYVQSFPFLHQPRQQPHPLSIAPHYTQQQHNSHFSSATPVLSSASASTSSSSQFSFPPDLPPSPTPRRPSPKRPPTASSSASASTSTSRSAAPAPAPLPPQPKLRAAPAPGAPKAALLSPSQKKANHIQSEQKRRANIRRGYEALCECVPALREAIREEEEAAMRDALPDTLHHNHSTKNSAGGSGSGNGKKRGGGAAGRAKRGDADGGEKTDGRAGPRSENVVLSKTIDYMNELLAERAALRSRLERARGMLPPGHPALRDAYGNGYGNGNGYGGEQPLWEREWKGGEGGDLGGTEDAEGEEDDEE
ncbi:hypothetical protein C8J57DRAFT_1170449 [Mycena rebaudengoi]|nr:hypothetical protein C8J57DRAFT_1170449 [Mycena rebaudengoi]